MFLIAFSDLKVPRNRVSGCFHPVESDSLFSASEDAYTHSQRIDKIRWNGDEKRALEQLGSISYLKNELGRTKEEFTVRPMKLYAQLCYLAYLERVSGFSVNTMSVE